MSEEKMTLKERFNELSPGVRLSIVFGAAAVLLVAGLILMPSKSGTSRISRNPPEPIKAEMLLPKGQDRTVEQLSGGLTATERDIDQIRRDIKRMKQDSNELTEKVKAALDVMQEKKSDDGISSELVQAMKRIEGRVALLEAKRDLDAPSMSPEPSHMEPTVQEGVVQEAPKIAVIRSKAKEPGKAQETPEDPVPYVVANSMFEAELLNGMDAPTDQSSRQNPVPAVLRVKSEAILPNMFNVSNVQECFLSVGGYGDMADERAKLRTEMLSCVVASNDPEKPPRIVEAKVDGYIVGEDGRVGMRGRLVSKQGQLIAKTLFAGTLAGFADGLRPQQIQGLDLNPTGNSARTQRNDVGTIAASGLAQGVSDTARSVSQYLLKMADQMMPVLEIDAGRKVTVVLLKGVELK
ncbi:TraB/VirB10 family protein [Allopusillimonas ginsengisoli]|uniref:TraB/VirB10 family protein n=1 Tax=Allopusillimonas ginsengisoli TaxID=453575 RepID=UPI0039C3A193